MNCEQKLQSAIDGVRQQIAQNQKEMQRFDSHPDETRIAIQSRYEYAISELQTALEMLERLAAQPPRK